MLLFGPLRPVPENVCIYTFKQAISRVYYVWWGWEERNAIRPLFCKSQAYYFQRLKATPECLQFYVPAYAGRGPNKLVIRQKDANGDTAWSLCTPQNSSPWNSGRASRLATLTISFRTGAVAYGPLKHRAHTVEEFRSLEATPSRSGLEFCTCCPKAKWTSRVEAF